MLTILPSNEWMNERTNEWMNEWRNERMNEWMNELMNEWMNEQTNERTNEWVSEWMNEWVNEWMNEWMNGWMNEWMDEGMNQATKQSSNQWTNESMSLRVSFLLAGCHGSWWCCQGYCAPRSNGRGAVRELDCKTVVCFDSFNAEHLCFVVFWCTFFAYFTRKNWSSCFNDRYFDLPPFCSSLVGHPKNEQAKRYRERMHGSQDTIPRKEGFDCFVQRSKIM